MVSQFINCINVSILIVIVLFIPSESEQSVPNINIIDEYLLHKEEIYNYELIKEYEAKLVISAEVMLKTKTGKSMMDTNISITKENVKDFEPSEENKKFAVTTLKELGFDVFPSELTLTITGDKSLFEKIFKTELNVKKEKGSIIINPSKQLVIPEKLSDVIESIVFPRPPQFFK